MLDNDIYRAKEDVIKALSEKIVEELKNTSDFTTKSILPDLIRSFTELLKS